MKKIIFALLLCLFATNVFCDIKDGRWWNNSNKYSKLDYVVGFSDCYTKLINNMQYAFEDVITQFAKGTSDKKLDKTTEEKIKKASSLMAVTYDRYPYGYNYGEIIDFIDKFFSNPQYKVLRLDDVLTIIIFPALKESWSQQEIDTMALALLKVTKKERENVMPDKKDENGSSNIGYTSSYRDEIGYCNP